MILLYVCMLFLHVMLCLVTNARLVIVICVGFLVKCLSYMLACFVYLVYASSFVLGL